jgi:hypothetical protein
VEDTWTKEEKENLARAVFDIDLFLRLATIRIENHPEKVPFKTATGHNVVNWLKALAQRYRCGEDITE